VTGAAGWRQKPEPWRSGAWFALLGMLPDIDLLFGAHSGPTHGLGAAVIVGLAAFALTRSGRIGLAASAAYASHILLDWLGSDSSVPIGIMALWPVRRTYYESDVHLFQAISRRYWMPGFWTHNLRAVMWELLILVPPAALALMLQRRAPRPIEMGKR
jgi:membrane-bound metal-dependent hydrolase YbcI (DUF457 family)